VRACPAVEGATNWFSPSFDPLTGLFFVQTLEKCSVYRRADGQWSPGRSFYNGSTTTPPEDRGEKVLRAIDVASGEVRWERRQTGAAETWGGTLSTASGLVFYGDDSGDFNAVGAKDGKLVWSFPANVHWKASPMTYSMEGRQFLAVAAGGNVIAFSLSPPE
jgi:alcohol dehydrogenase (cytochrome c)